MSKSSSWLVAFVSVVFFAFASYWWLNQGYGEVSAQTYAYSKALYGACQTQNEEHLDKVEELLVHDATGGLSDKERSWLKAIIAKARKGNWKTAARNARRIMEDQVQY